VPQLWAASVLFCFGLLAAVLVCVETIEAAEYLAALAAAAIGLLCALGIYLPIRSKTVRRWWW
jgi:Flp pilus assembly protein protease CpaA